MRTRQTFMLDTINAVIVAVGDSFFSYVIKIVSSSFAARKLPKTFRREVLTMEKL